MGKRTAPFFPAEVESLNGFQKSGFMHPFTCGNCRADLVATADGWVCPRPGCDYRQDWAHDFMADGGWRAMSEAVRGLFSRPAGGVAIKRQGPASASTGEVP